MKGGEPFFGERFEVHKWPVVRVVGKTLSELSQHDIKKAALYCHTFRRNNNEPRGL